MRLRRARPPMAASPLASSDRVLGSGTIVYLPLSRLYPRGLGPKNPAVNVPQRAKLSPKDLSSTSTFPTFRFSAAHCGGSDPELFTEPYFAGDDERFC